MKIFIGLIMLTVSLTVSAQRFSIIGSVHDAVGGEPIAGAVVKCAHEVVLTNSAGFYSLKVAGGTVHIECSLLGYKTMNRRIECISDSMVNFRMEMIDNRLEEVVVVGNYSSIGSKFGKVSVSMNQLKYTPLFMGEQDIFKYFQMLPGVVGGKEGASELNIRGGNSDQTLILLDDVPIYNQNHALGFVSIFNGDALSGAELYKGGMPTHYGGRLSGVAAMTTREGDKETHKQVLTIGTLTASLLAEGPLKRGKSSYIFSGRYFTPHLLLTGIYTAFDPTPRINYLFWDVTGKLTFRLNKRNTLAWSIYTGNDAMTYKVKDNFTLMQEQEQISHQSRGGYYWGALASALKLNSQFSNGTSLNTTLYYTAINNRITGDYKNHTDDIWMESQLLSTIREVGLKMVAQQNLARGTLTYGLHASNQHFRPKEIFSHKGGINNGNITLSTVALFAEEDITFGKWAFRAGARVQLYYNGRETIIEIEPRLGVSFELSSKSTLFASYDRNTQPLFSLNRQYSGQPIDFWMPFRGRGLESAQQWAVGWKLRPSQRLFFSVEGFYKRLNNLYFVSDEDKMLADEGGFQVGKGSAFGGELTAQYSDVKSTVMLSYAHTLSKRTIENHSFDFAYDVPHNLNVYFKQLTLRRGERSQYFSANLNFRSGLPYILSNEVYPSYNIEGEGSISIPNNPLYPNMRLIHYFRLDLNYSMEKQLPRGRRVWQISILNATNHFNPYVIVNHGTKIDAVSLIPFMPSFSYKRYF